MKFSIIIPVYNTEKYINDCMESILNQTFCSFEIVLIDDGSTDSSPLICDSLLNQYPDIVKVFHQKNSGQLVSRCNGVRISTGDYCLFVDSDDIIVKDCLQVLKETIELYSFPDAILYPFYYEEKGKRTLSKTFNDCNRYYNQDEIKEVRELFFTTSIMDSMCTKAIKRSVLAKSIYDTENYNNLRCSEDRLQAMWAFDNIKTVAYINLPLYIYRLFSGSTTRSFSYDSIEKNRISPLYSIERAYLEKWGFNTSDWFQRFDASWITYMIYVFLLFYSECERNERKRIMSYDWKSFMPAEVMSIDIQSNPFISDVQKQLYVDILRKNAETINRYVWKRKVRMKYKSIKRKLLN